jgi:cytidine deaminase
MIQAYKELTKSAQDAMRNAYSPFSKFRVGAALLAKNGRIFMGCNIENSSYGLTICAERVAMFNAISSGASKFAAIAVVSDDPGYTPPCGACRQVLLELAGDIDFVMMDSKNRYKVVKLSTLLPFAFTEKNLKRTHKSMKKHGYVRIT